MATVVVGAISLVAGGTRGYSHARGAGDPAAYMSLLRPPITSIVPPRLAFPTGARVLRRHLPARLSKLESVMSTRSLELG